MNAATYVRVLAVSALMCFGAVAYAQSPIVIAEGQPYSPLVAVSSTGRIHVVWHEGVDAFTKFSDDHGASFSPVRPISGIGRVEAIAVGADGTVYVAGSGTGLGGNQDISLARSVDGGITFSARNLTNDTSYSLRPTLAATGESVFVLWEDWETLLGPKRALFSRSLDSGVTFNEPIEPFAGLFFGFGNFGGPSSMLAMTATASGAVVIATNAYLTANLSDPTQIWVVHSADGTSFAGPVAVQNGPDPYVSTISVTMDQTEALHIVWHSGLLSSVGDHALKYARAAGPGQPFNQPETFVSPAGSDFRPIISVDQQDRPIVVWSMYHNSGLSTATVTSSGHLTESVLYLGQSESDSLDPAAVQGPDGTLWVVWAESEPTPSKRILLLGRAEGGAPLVCDKLTFFLESDTNIHLDVSGSVCNGTLSVKNPKFYWTNFTITVVGDVTITPFGGESNPYVTSWSPIRGLLPPARIPSDLGASVEFSVKASGQGLITVFADPTAESGLDAGLMNMIQIVADALGAGAVVDIAKYGLVVQAFQRMPHLQKAVTSVFKNPPAVLQAWRELVAFVLSSTEVTTLFRLLRDVGVRIGLDVIRGLIGLPIRVINVLASTFGNIYAAFFEFPTGTGFIEIR